MPLFGGAYDGYQWLSADHEIDIFWGQCSNIVLGKYLVVTADDSGPYLPSEHERQMGWTTRGDIALSPRINKADSLPSAGFTELNCFDSLKGACQMPMRRLPELGGFEVFVNRYGFALHVREMQETINTFWQQMKLFQPQSYIGDGSHCLTFVTKDLDVFYHVRQALENTDPRWCRLG